METATTDTVPRISRCPQCGSVVLSAWSNGAPITADVTTFSSEVAHLSHLSGQTVYRVRATRRATLVLVGDADEIIDHRAYVLGHACTETTTPDQDT
ncbi:MULTISPECIES: hypothetical protein [unclassified Nocardiopsis]|uniref:hypothetical protein n=1 Tax=unclassified Nocardiopsis TaxID=2649073 RepID=UPI001358ECE6|nr:MULTISPECIES: hypothetical protein [unclassified Nocardiopsis]